MAVLEIASRNYRSGKVFLSQCFEIGQLPVLQLRHFHPFLRVFSLMKYNSYNKNNDEVICERFRLGICILWWYMVTLQKILQSRITVPTYFVPIT